jgi:hypothetical protein
MRFRLAAAIVVLASAPDLPAQEEFPSRNLTFVAGPAEYDLSGTGWSWSVAARLDLPLGRLLLLEPGIGFFTYNSQFDSRTSYLFPEVSLQLQYPGSSVRPYVGVGAGGAFVLEGGPGSSTEPTVHAALGLRLGVNERWGLRTEARFRNITFDANASIFEIMLGFSRAF